jgi:Ca2+-binding EF-hand superfamily protein
LRDAFNMFDADRSGFIDRDEVRALMKKLAQTLTEDEISAIMEEVDTDGDGEISFEEFRAMMFS